MSNPNDDTLSDHDTPSATEIIQLKRRLAATHQELDEARVGGRKKIL